MADRRQRPMGRIGVGAQAPGAGSPALQAVAAGAGVNEFAMARPLLPLLLARGFNVFARAGAGVGQAARHQQVEGELVHAAAFRLPHGRLVGVQAAGRQLRQDQAARAGYAARCVQVFHAHQPFAAVGPGVQPTGQRRHQRARVQGTGG